MIYVSKSYIRIMRMCKQNHSCQLVLYAIQQPLLWCCWCELCKLWYTNSRTLSNDEENRREMMDLAKDGSISTTANCITPRILNKGQIESRSLDTYSIIDVSQLLFSYSSNIIRLASRYIQFRLNVLWPFNKRDDSQFGIAC